MRICEIKIEEFGGIANKSITLSPDFNLLVGDNESGKSTLCDFIKYIFYGFVGSDEKLKRSNNKTGNAAGYIVIEDENFKRFRIERIDSDKTKNRVSVFKEADGSSFTDWKSYAKTPGEYFLGVSEKLYTRSLYVSQENGAMLDGGSSEAVSNLLLSGDEAVNLNRARLALENYRKELRLKRGRGGIICDLEDKISALRERFQNAVKNKNDIEELTDKISEKEKTLEKYRAELDTASASLLYAKAAKIQGLLEKKRSIEDNIIALKNAEADLTEKAGENGFLPDESYISELKIAESAAKSYKESYDELNNKIGKIAGEKNSTVPKGYQQYVDMGGKHIVKPKYERQTLRRRRFKVFSIFFLIFAIASVVSMILPESFKIDKAQSQRLAIISFSAAAICFVIHLIFLFLLHGINKKLLINSKRKYEQAFSEFDAYENAHKGDLASLSDTLSGYEKRSREQAEKLRELLEKWGKSSVKEAKESFDGYCHALLEIRNKTDRLQGERNICIANLSVYTENEINAAKKFSISDSDKAKYSTFSESRVAELDEAIRRTDREISDLKVARAGISQGDSDELNRLDVQICEYEKELSEYKEKYEAALLAMEALDTAENGIRHTVSPYLSANSGEYFEALTNGRYTGLVLDGEMNLKYKRADDGLPTDSMYLSGGSSDLAWICLRLALHKKLSESRCVPIILDECFVYFDDTRLKAILEKLLEISKENKVQVLLFSASSREKNILADKVNTVLI